MQNGNTGLSYRTERANQRCNTMQLSGPEILRRLQIPNPNNPDGHPDIVIKPFDERCLGSNSYDVHLSDTLRVYKKTIPAGMRPAIPYNKDKQYSMRDWFITSHAYQRYLWTPGDFDPRNPQFLINPCMDGFHDVMEIKIPDTGLILSPLVGYLGDTVEYTETYNLFPYIDGKSSVGRNFILVHYTAGRGDDGFRGTWTLEISTKYPTVVYPNMRIGQLYYEEFKGDRKPYHVNQSSHYDGQRGPRPAAPIPIDNFIAKTR